MKVALDTNILVAYFNGEPRLVQRVKTAQQLFLPLPVLAESLFGAKNSARAAENLAKLHIFRGSCTVLPIEEPTADFYADIWLERRTKGRPIPMNDVWSAALCRQHSLPLASRDTHFDHISGFQRLAW